MKEQDEFHAEMEVQQKVLEEEKEQVEVQREEWEEQKKQIEVMAENAEKLVRLNVGGTELTPVSRDVLTSVDGSLLATVFSGKHDLKTIEDHVFLDRDTKSFE